MNTLSPGLQRARQAMITAGVDAVLVGSPGLVAFLTGHVIPSHLAYPSRDGRMEKPTLALVTRDGLATIGSMPTPSVGNVVPYGIGARGLSDNSDAFAAVLAAAKTLGLRAGKLAVELALVPAGALAAISEACPALKVLPLDRLFSASKSVKDADELKGIAEALALCDAGQNAVRAAVVSGQSELDFYCAAVQAMNKCAGSLVLSLGEVQVGSRGELMMGAPTGAQIADGELVMCDLAPRHPNGWWGDSCITVACGQPDITAKTVWRELRDGMEAGREMLRPGIAACDVYAQLERYAGYLHGHGGHSIGRDHYEDPHIGPNNTEQLLEDTVIVLEPGRYGAGRGMRIEHAFRVTPSGGVPLSTFDLAL